ncbi:MAG: radical SAM protein [Candidatus Saccharimonadales bacterium]
MSEALLSTPKDPTINFAIGPNCPVRCEGCYNHFGETAQLGGLLTAEQVIEFAADARAEGITQTTLSGGDPLFHPEIVPIVSGLKDLGMKIKLDTVGTAFLDDVPIVYKGRGIASKVEVTEIAPHVDFVNVPLDGSKQETVAHFRRGRANLLAETKAVAGLLRKAGIDFGFNTVANARNLDELPAMRDIAEEEGAVEWQIFEYDPDGPNPTNKKSSLQLAPGKFDQATKDLVSTSGRLRIVGKSLETRSGAYFLVDDSGLAWKPAGGGFRHVLGSITTDRAQVLVALRQHIEQLQQ